MPCAAPAPWPRTGWVTRSSGNPPPRASGVERGPAGATPRGLIRRPSEKDPRSMAKIAFLFPGQGAQAVGMGRELDRQLPAARALFDRAGEILGFDLRAVCFDGPA